MYILESNINDVSIGDKPVEVYSIIDINSTSKKILDVNVVIDIEHTYTGDLTVSLKSPAGTSVKLVSNRGNSGDNFNGTAFDDQATTEIRDGKPPFIGHYRPEEKLSAFKGENPTGKWTLSVADNANGDGGTLKAWILYVDLIETEPPTYTYDKERFHSTMASLASAAAAKKALQYVRCVGGNWGDIDVLLRCMGMRPMPQPPHPVAQNDYVPTSIVENILELVDERERNQVGAALVKAQGKLLAELLSELVRDGSQ